MRWAASFIFPAFFVMALIWLGPAKILSVFTSLTPSVLLVIFQMMILNNLIRALRFRVALVEYQDFGLGKFWCVVNVHQFLNYIFPARTGELSFLYLSQRFLSQTYGASAGVLIIVRLLDLMLLIFFFVVGLLSLTIRIDHVASLLWLAGLTLIFLLLAGILGVPASVRGMRRLSQRWMGNASSGTQIREWVSRFFREMDEHLNERISWRTRLSLVLAICFLSTHLGV
jgi:hypothetical protein